ncbi:MAG: flavin reductase [Planctomycetaceae bacterium]
MNDSTFSRDKPPKLVTLDVDFPVWDRFFMVAPLVVIGSREPDGSFDLAPKHMVTPLSWENYFGFVCTPAHATYRNIQREGTFTVSFPKADQVVLTSLSAAPRCDAETNEKPSLAALPTIKAEKVDGVFLRDASLFFECELHSIVDGFGINSLIAGRIVAAHAIPEVLRSEDKDDQDVIRQLPLLAYLSPGRFTEIQASSSFPFPAGFAREPRK